MTEQPTQCPKAPQCEVAKHNACTLAELHERCGVYKQLLQKTADTNPKTNEVLNQM